MKKFTLMSVVFVALMGVGTVSAEDSTSLYIEANNDVGNEVHLTAEQKAILDNMPNLEREYLEQGLKEPVYIDPKSVFRARIGGWSWRDGVICVTDEGIGTRRINTWHAAIVVPQRAYVVAEAPGVSEKVRFRYGEWKSSSHTIWQVGVKIGRAHV